MSPRRQVTADRSATAAAQGQQQESGDSAAPQAAGQPGAGDQAGKEAGRAKNGNGTTAVRAGASGVAKPAGGASGDKLPTRVPASQRRQSPVRPKRKAKSGQVAPLSAVDAGVDDQAIATLSARLMALARMIQIGSARSSKDGFSKVLLTEAEEMLARAGERMRLSSSHTVVILAGGTGSGKSSLFNQLAGADFSTVGVTRPVTMQAHACIWGATGSGALLDWLGVPARYRYSRASALDRGEADLVGLVLLDLPDHDSVMSHAGDPVDRLVGLADVMIWVLDPQKYADAAVHRRFLVPMAGHSDVLAVVLNQTDLLDPAQVDDCVADLRRLLDAEDLPDVPILVTSAVTGAGVDVLRKLLVDGVAARRASTIRISADLNGMVAKFVPFGGPAHAAPAALPPDSKEQLAGRFSEAAGVDAVSDALRSARELRAADFVGWPVAWLMQRLAGRDPMRKVRLGELWNDLRSISAGPAGAQQADIDNALTEFGDRVASPLPAPWSQSMRSAVRSNSDAISAAVGGAIGDALPAEDSVVWWWRLAGAWQGLLLGVAAVSVAWMAVITILGLTEGGSAGTPGLFSNFATLPWPAAAAIVALGLGAATAAVSMSEVRKEAERENTKVAADMRARIAEVAAEMVLVPAEQELSEFERYREELKIAEAAAAAE